MAIVDRHGIDSEIQRVFAFCGKEYTLLMKIKETEVVLNELSNHREGLFQRAQLRLREFDKIPSGNRLTGINSIGKDLLAAIAHKNPKDPLKGYLNLIHNNFSLSANVKLKQFCPDGLDICEFYDRIILFLKNPQAVGNVSFFAKGTRTLESALELMNNPNLAFPESLKQKMAVDLRALARHQIEPKLLEAVDTFCNSHLPSPAVVTKKFQGAEDTEVRPRPLLNPSDSEHTEARQRPPLNPSEELDDEAPPPPTYPLDDLPVGEPIPVPGAEPIPNAQTLEIEKLKSQVNTLEEKNRGLHADLNSSAASLLEAQEKLQKIPTLEKKLEDAQAELAQKEFALSHAKQEIKRLEGLEAKLKSLQDFMAQMTQAMTAQLQETKVVQTENQAPKLSL